MERKSALITGGSGGIGLELAREFARTNHDLILVARHGDTLDAVAGALEGKHGIKVTTIVADLAEADSPQRIFDTLNADHIEVDYLVNNAGFGLGGEFADTNVERELDMIQVNISSLIHLTKLFMQPMLKRKHGGIMNVASVAAFQPGPLMSVYYASKSFVLSFTEAIAEELRDSGVRVSCLCPGPVATSFADAAGIKPFTKVGNQKADEVARYGYAALMRGERVAIPGRREKIIVQAERFAPRNLLTRMVRIAQQNR